MADKQEWHADANRLRGTVVYDDGDARTVVLGAKISGGVYGNVYKGTMRTAGKTTPVAVKIQPNCVESQVEIEQYERLWADEEAAVAGCICRAYGTQMMVFGPRQFSVLVMARYAGTLWTMRERMSAANIYSVMRDMSLALEYFHRPIRRPGGMVSTAHADVHANNIFLAADFTAYLGDFGWSREYYEMPAGTCCLVDRTVLPHRYNAASLTQMRQHHREYCASRRSDLLMLMGAAIQCFTNIETGGLWHKVFALNVEKKIFTLDRRPPGWVVDQLAGEVCADVIVHILVKLFETCDCLTASADMYLWLQEPAGVYMVRDG